MSKVIVKLAGVDHSCCRTGTDLLLFSFFLSFFFFREWPISSVLGHTLGSWCNEESSIG